MKEKLREFWAGATTFFTMSYILFVNPSILANEATGMPFNGVLTATVLASFCFTLLMGLYAKLPYALAPGMGLNAFFTYSIIIGQKIPWQTALGMVFWSGVLFTLLSLTPIRAAIALAIPKNLRIGIAAGIGLLLSFIGLKNLGIIVANPATLVTLGPMTIKAAFALIGFACIFWLHEKRNPLAFLSGIISITILAWFFGEVKTPTSLLAKPDFTTFMQLDFIGALQLSLLPAILSLMLTDFFDSIATFMGVAHATDLTDTKGEPKNIKQALVVDALATLGSGLLGTSSTTTYIESSAGIEAGGRSHWTAIFCALLFLPCLFFAPIIAMVPAYATAPVLIIIGAMMFRSLFNLKLTTWEDVFPVFLAVVLIPLTFSITQGILWAFVAHTGLFILAKRQKELPVMMWILSGLAFAMLVFLN